MPPPTPPSPTLTQLDRALHSQHERRVALCSEYSNLQRARSVEDKALAAKRKDENEALARELEGIGREEMRLQNERVRIECGLSRGDMEQLMGYSGNGNTIMPSHNTTATAASSMTGSDAAMIVRLKIPQPGSEQEEEEVVEQKSPTQNSTGCVQAGEDPHLHSGSSPRPLRRAVREKRRVPLPIITGRPAKKTSGVKKTTGEDSMSSRKRSHSQRHLPSLKEDRELVKRHAVMEEEGGVEDPVMDEDGMRDNNLAKGEKLHEDADLFWSDSPSSLSSVRSVPSSPNWSSFWDTPVLTQPPTHIQTTQPIFPSKPSIPDDATRTRTTPPPTTPHPDLPSLTILLHDPSYIPLLKKTLTTHFPSHASKIPLTILDTSLGCLPRTTRFDCIVSPANSYARLDGAFDDAISRLFCLPEHEYNTLTRAAQQAVYERWRGYVPPGTCMLVRFPGELERGAAVQEGDGEGEGGNEWNTKGKVRGGCKYLALCPTMRTPENVVWDREVVYKCVWALLCEVEGWNRRVRREKRGSGSGTGTGTGARGDSRIDTVLMPPLATGVGGVSKERWAEQFVLALKHFVDALERPERWASLGWGDVVGEAREVEGTWRGEERAQKGKGKGGK
ncbi:hypothetical protein FQN51_006184 [Onygenales sp. PD_10]|nr:hypothetical protein FQN51_006184 [Onygenales sp. PD_10]